MESVSTFKQLCCAPLESYFPFPDELYPKKEKASVYVVPHMEEDRRFVEHMIVQKGGLKKSSRHLQLDYTTGELVIYSDSDGIQAKKKAKDILRAELLADKGAIKVSFASGDPLTFSAASPKKRPEIISDINAFAAAFVNAPEPKKEKKKKDRKKDRPQETKEERRERKERKKEEKERKAAAAAETEGKKNEVGSKPETPPATPEKVVKEETPEPPAFSGFGGFGVEEVA